MHARLIESIKEHEGFRKRAYKDSLGIWTIGYGTNLQSGEISEETAEMWLLRDLDRVVDALDDVKGFKQANEVRRAVLVEMGYQLGITGCLRFKKMWTAIRAEDWWAAASEMLDSRWAKQTSARAIALSNRMRHGTWDGSR
ncbi:MAG: glycoside hydrolase family protein [Candidatus Thorarchaeota archaeon]